MSLLHLYISGLSLYVNTTFNVSVYSSQLRHYVSAITISTLSSRTSTYIIIAMTFERCYSIVKPHKAASFNTVKRANFTISCIVLFHVIYCLPLLYTTAPSGGVCLVFHRGIEHFLVRIYYWFNQFHGFGLPFVVLLIMNSIIINKLRRRPKLLQKKKEGQIECSPLGNVTKLKTSERQIIIMLLFITFSFLILMIPSCFRLFFSSFVNFKTSPYLYAIFHLSTAIGGKAYTTNYAINFYLYVISGQKFRSDLIQLFKNSFSCFSKREKDCKFGSLSIVKPVVSIISVNR